MRGFPLRDTFSWSREVFGEDLSIVCTVVTQVQGVALAADGRTGGL